MADVIFRVNMSDLSTKVEAVPAEWMGLGGRGLTSTIVAAEVEPTCHPLGPRNKLVIAPGLLSGTQAANSGRLLLRCQKSAYRYHQGGQFRWYLGADAGSPGSEGVDYRR